MPSAPTTRSAPVTITPWLIKPRPSSNCSARRAFGTFNFDGKNDHASEDMKMKPHRIGLSSIAGCAALLITAGCRQAHDPGEPTAVRVENNQVLVTPGSAPASSVSVETAKPPAPPLLLLNGRLVWD